MVRETGIKAIEEAVIYTIFEAWKPKILSQAWLMTRRHRQYRSTCRRFGMTEKATGKKRIPLYRILTTAKRHGYMLTCIEKKEITAMHDTGIPAPGKHFHPYLSSRNGK